MAHNLNFNSNTGKHSFFSVKEKAWHNLGQLVEESPTSEEAINLAGLNYNVERMPIYASLQTTFEKVQAFYATIRTDTNQILGIVGDKYEIVQNREAFTFFDEIVQSGKVKYETAGALGKGERIFITVKMPDCLRISRNDIIEKYIFLTTSHDGSGAIMAAFTPVRIVCNNTLNMALKNHSNAVYIRHTANASEKLKQAARIMHISENTGQILEQMFKLWTKVSVNDNEAKKLIALAMAPNKEVFEAIASNNQNFEFSTHFESICGDVWKYAQEAPSQQLETTKGTIFGVYNSITGFYQNMANYKNDTHKLNSIMFGTALERTKKAFEICQTAQQFLS